MALSNEETAELRETYSLLSADELRSSMGDGDEQDAIIRSILDAGKAIETKGSEAAAIKNGTDPASQAADKAKSATDGGEGEGEDEDEGLVDAHGRPVVMVDGKPVLIDPKDIAAAAAAGDDDAAAEEAAAAAAAADEATAAAATTTTVEDVSAAVLPVSFTFADTRLAGRLAELDAAKSAAFVKLMDGTLPPEEYAQAEAQYMRDRDAAKDNHTFEKDWTQKVHALKVEAAKTVGINYDTDTEKGDALDTWIRALGSNPKYADKSPEWFLQEAHKKVMLEFEIVPPAAKQAPKDQKATVSANKVAQKTGRAPNLSDIPPTLGGLPAAKESDINDGGEFAHLDKLTGMELEYALARLSAEQKDRYERA